MAYQTGDTILDDHYNGFSNDNSPNNINKIWGTGSGDYGYGQTNTISTVSAGATVTATQWNTVLDRMQSIANHQNSSITSGAGTLSGGDPIQAILSISTDITTIGTNRLNVAPANVTLSNAVTGTRTFTGTWTTSTIHEVSYTFASGDAARYFFNAGGTIRWDGSMNGFTANFKALDWENLLETRFGTFSFGATSSSISGNGTLSTNNSSTGYHDLVGTGYNTIFKMFGGQLTYSYYNTNFVQVDVKTNGVQGANSDNGSVITVKVTMSDASADDGGADDQINGNLVSNWGYNKPNTTYLNNDAVGTITTAEVSQSQS